MVETEVNYGTTYPIESLKVIAESIGITGLFDDAAKEMSDDISFRLKHIFQDAMKFAVQSRRTRLSPCDIDNLLKYRNVEPVYGVSTADHIPFRFASGGGRELHFIEDKEIDLNSIPDSLPAKVPTMPTLHTHWLAIDGIQPTVPENPPPVTKDVLKTETVDPVNKLKTTDKDKDPGKIVTGKVHKLRSVETVHVKQLATHELSVEQQLYYKEITEACVGCDETRRAEALNSLATDPGLYEMLPRMCTFIAEGVKVNVVQSNLALLIYLMRMVKALLENPSLYLEKYLHELIPSIMTCIVTKNLCTRPGVDNHWALRDYACKLICEICKMFNSSTNNIQARITRIFTNALDKPQAPFPTLYGAINGLSELSVTNVSAFIVPKLKDLGSHLGAVLQNPDSDPIDRVEASHVQGALQKCVVGVIMSMRHKPDSLEEYTNEYGYLGPWLHSAVSCARSQPVMTA